MEAAEKELKGLIDMGITLSGEIGEVINKQKAPPESGITVFQSLGK